MPNHKVPTQRDFLSDLAEIDHRMDEIKKNLQPHFDRSALSLEQQASFYDHMRQQIPVTMEQESRGVSPAQLLNAQQERIRNPQDLTIDNWNVIDQAIESVFKNPSYEIRKFISDNFNVLLTSEREGFKTVIASYNRRTCIGCHQDDSVFIDVAPLLASIRAGHYPLAHIWRNQFDDEYWCSGPKLMASNNVNHVKFATLMANVKDNQAKHQVE